MSLLDEPILEGTTAADDFSDWPELILLRREESLAGTSSDEPTRLWDSSAYESCSTGAGWNAEVQVDPESEPESTRQAVSALRRISGLTWEQLAHLFGVSRRSLHFWASGKPLNSANEERLRRVLDVVGYADRGAASQTRAALLDGSQGTTALELLAGQRFEEARALLGQGRPRAAVPRTELSAAARAARKPPPPADLVEAKGDRVDSPTGRGRAARTVRAKGRGTSR